MRTMRVWVASTIVGITLILFGTWMAWDGLEEDHEFEVSRQVDSERIYYLKLEPKVGKEVSSSYELSEGTMTVAILSKKGLNDMISSGFSEPADVYFEMDETNNGTISWIPADSGTYYIAFYGFSVDGSLLDAQGSYLGSIPALIYIGLGIVVAGVAALVISAVMRLRSAVASRSIDRGGPAEDVATPPEEPAVEEKREIDRE